MTRVRLFLALWLASVSAPVAAADFKITSPNVDEGEFEFENRAYSAPGHDGGRDATTELGYGLTEDWRAEIETEFEKEPAKNWRHSAMGLENVFQLSPEGQETIDLGLYAEYQFAVGRDQSDEFVCGPLVQKQWGKVLATANLFVTAQFGGPQPRDPQFSYGLEVRYLLSPFFQPGVQAFGNPGPFDGFDQWSQQDHRIGPVLFGSVDVSAGEINYEFGYLVGLTNGSPDGTMKFAVEYEASF
jgi:hypothetical protein